MKTSYSQNFNDQSSLINQLKSRIFDLEQNEKNYQALSNSHVQLQTSYQQLNDEKLRSDYENKQKSEIQTKTINDLRSDNENLQMILNEKININKKLYSDNETLLNQLDAANNEIASLNAKLTEALAKIETLKNEKNSAEKINYDLTATVAAQKDKIEKLFDDNKKLNTICKEQDNALNQNEEDKTNLVSKIEEINYELSNLKGKIKSKEENLIFVQSQNEDMKNEISNYEIQLSQLEKKNLSLSNEVDNYKHSLENEKSKSEEIANNAEQIEKCLKDRERDLDKFMEELDKANITIRALNTDKGNLNEEKEKLIIQVKELTEKNQSLLTEIRNVIDNNAQAKELLDRKDRIYNLIKRNKLSIERSLNNFNEENKAVVNSRIVQDDRVNHSEIISNAKVIDNVYSPVQEGLNLSI